MNLPERKWNTIEFKVHGNYAVFSDPLMRVGGEKCTYQTPTYEAVKGIVESIYWKPTFIWVVDAVRVMKPICTESKGVKTRNIDKGGYGLSYYTYLRDVEYQVRAHFEWNMNYPDLEGDRNDQKHHCIAKRSVEKGGRRDIFLGARECQAYVEPCVFGEGKGYYDEYGELSFGRQFHSFGYPNETGKNVLTRQMWMAKMKDGIICFPRPEECFSERIKEYERNIKDVRMTVLSVEEEYKNLEV